MVEATFSYYPIPDYGSMLGRPNDPLGNKLDAEILRRLGVLEERLSKIEQLMASNQGPPK
jgi:hypothetical protein